MLIINDTLSTYGGSMDLLEQICIWCKANNVTVMVICDSAENISLVERLKRNKVEIRILNTYNYKRTGRFLGSINEEVEVISFKYAEFINIEISKKYSRNDVKNILYTIHKSAFDRGSRSPNSLFRVSYNKIMINVLEKYGSNGNVIMQDEINYEHMECSLKHCFSCAFPIVRQPYQLRYMMEYDEEEMIKKGYDSNTIITAARAEFPFKGYIIGLLDDWKMIKDKYPDCILEIVADGEDITVLKNKVKGINKLFPDSIKLKKWMKIDDLLENFSEAKLFVGVGTALLGAAEIPRPCIPVQEGSMRCLSDGFFSETVNYVAADSCTQSAATTIYRALNMDYCDYRRECKKTKETLQCYNINYSMRVFLEKKVKRNDSLLSFAEWLFYLGLNWIDSQKNRKRNRGFFFPG